MRRLVLDHKHRASGARLWPVPGLRRYSRRALRLVWSETGGPETAPPTRRGFGRRLIEHGVGYSLSGQTRFEFRPEGLRCEITIPLDRAAARA